MAENFRVAFGVWDEPLSIEGEILNCSEEAPEFWVYEVREHKSEKIWLIPLTEVLYLQEIAPAKKMELAEPENKVVALSSYKPKEEQK